MRLALKKLVINTLQILFVVREPNETLDVRNFVPSEAEVLKSRAARVTPFENSATETLRHDSCRRQWLVHGRTSVFDGEVSEQENKRHAGQRDHLQELKAVHICQ
jgi:hypothetical protein